MITESIVKQTIEMLEDFTDIMATKVKFMANAERPVMDERLAEAHSLLNF